MSIWGSYDLDQEVDSGRFYCPQCDVSQNFTLVRTWSYFHVFLIPLVRDQLVSERVVCNGCDSAFPITVLGSQAKSISAASAAGAADSHLLADNFGNIVELTTSAIEEVKRLHREGQLEPDVVVRIEPDTREPYKITVAFDFALADGRDWIGESQGIPIVVDRRVAPELQGSTIDFTNGVFVRTSTLRSYRRECEAAPDFEPDATGYEQAPHGHNVSDSTLQAGKEEEGELPSISDPATVCAFEYIGEADTCCELLDNFGIQTRLVHISGTNPFLPNAAYGVAVQVPSSDIERARTIIEEYHSIREEQYEARSQDENITFECEQCGAEITFPAHRQGGVEVCPHCGEYVDVPE
jgi:Fe-S cluster assembly iron-binding protein IscA